MANGPDGQFCRLSSSQKRRILFATISPYLLCHLMNDENEIKRQNSRILQQSYFVPQNFFSKLTSRHIRKLVGKF